MGDVAVSIRVHRIVRKDVYRSIFSGKRILDKCLQRLLELHTATVAAGQLGQYHRTTARDDLLRGNFNVDVAAQVTRIEVDSTSESTDHIFASFYTTKPTGFGMG